MTDDNGEDEREIELSAIAAIFPELILEASTPFIASIDLPVSPSKPLAVVFPSLTDGAPRTGLPTPPHSEGLSDGEAGARNGEDRTLVDVDAPKDVHHLAHLPPVTLEIVLPDGYPAEKPPVFDLSASPAWIPPYILERLKVEGAKLWEGFGRDQVVFAYIDHLQQEAEQGFGLINDPDAPLEVAQDLKIAVLDYDIRVKREKFEQETFECGVCLGRPPPQRTVGRQWVLTIAAEPKKGSSCHRLLLCSHVFCIGCLQDFYNNCIAEGNVANVKCLAPNCGKGTALQPAPEQIDPARAAKRKRIQDRTLNPSELLQIPLEENVVKRYVELKRKAKLESDKTTVYCPRKWCQGAARSKKYPKATGLIDIEAESDEESEAEATLEDGAGAKSLPPPSERLKICEDCGFAFCCVCFAGWHGELFRCRPADPNLLSEEEQASEEYMRLHTTPCPTAHLAEGNPYAHYNEENSPCNQRLWELEGGDGGEDVGLGFGGGARGGAQVHEGLQPLNHEDDASDDEEDDVHENNVPPPPPAPIPPRAAAAPRPAVRGGGAQQRPAPRPRVPPGLRPGDHPGNDIIMQRREANDGLHALAARGDRRAIEMIQGRALRGGRNAAAPPRAGLRRFLQLVENDEEDEWDSDELDDDGDDEEDGWEIPLR
ncbi:MAG: translation termination inhibitor protein itt1 [Pycnora praestabilis]|nr:MAG: translation termination inhibitor protein itt1 [Pycnora praestabilis]